MLAGEDARLHTRAVRIRRFGISALAVLTAAAVTASVVAVQQRGVALDNQALAEQRARIAISRQLAAQSSEMRSIDSNLAKQLGIVAHRTAPTAEATSTVLNSLNVPGTIALPTPLLPTDAQFSPDGRILATVGYEVRLWDTTSPVRPRSLSTI